MEHNNNQIENNQNNERQRAYEQYVKEVNDRIKSNQESQDKMILTISVGLFGILSFFLEKMPATCIANCMIVFLLIFNTSTLISTLLSFYFCHKGNKADIEYAEKYYLESKEEYFDKQNCWTKSGEKCNSISLVFFIVTLIFYAIIMGYYFVNKPN
ncbi:MAG TPA: hypothetical protein IAA33_03285 [Candidatus Helicobacter avicola]|nr:hypothetical protein [Candidatus Helicobacter avicola]